MRHGTECTRHHNHLVRQLCSCKAATLRGAGPRGCAAYYATRPPRCPRIVTMLSEQRIKPSSLAEVGESAELSEHIPFHLANTLRRFLQDTPRRRCKSFFCPLRHSAISDSLPTYLQLISVPSSPHHVAHRPRQKSGSTPPRPFRSQPFRHAISSSISHITA